MNSLLARIAVIAPEGLVIFVQFAVDVFAHRMEAQIKVGSIQRWISTSDNVQRNTITMSHSDDKQLQVQNTLWNVQGGILCWWAATARFNGSKINSHVLF